MRKSLVETDSMFVFVCAGSLAALVYQHSITPLALPCKLNLPDAGEQYIHCIIRKY